MKFEWEVLLRFRDCSSNGFFSERAKVFGGWIVRNVFWDNEYNQQSESSIFVPDPNHEWRIE